MNNKKSLAFYDVNLLNHKNYVGDIVREFVSHGYLVTLFYDEYSKEGFDFFKELDVSIVRNGFFSLKSIKGKILKSNASILIVNAQRLSDTAFVTIARHLGVKTVMSQHGMYIPFMKRERLFLIKKVVKACRYVFYSLVVSKVLNKEFKEVFRCFVGTFIKGKVYRESIHFHQDVNVDFVLVYGPYWKGYHNEIFGYKSDQMYDIGFHELSKVEKVKAEPIEKSTVCYVAQTLVEDGRLPRRVMEEFLRGLELLGQRFKVIVKLHPRSERTMYEDRGLTLESSPGVPHCPLYLGHYSSLLALAASVSTVLIFEFYGHDTPEYFSRNSKVLSNVDELIPNVECIFSNDIESKGRMLGDVFSPGYSTESVFKLIESFW
jgi:hypothetical protein